MNELKFIEQWLGNHPLTLASLTLMTGGVISVFSGDIRQFIKIQPQRLNIWILRARLNSALADLDRVTKICNDSHELLKSIRTFLINCTAGLTILIAVIALQITGHIRGKEFSTLDRRINIVWILIGTNVLFVNVFRAMMQTWKLRDYELYKVWAMTKIRSLTARLEKHNTSN